MKLNKIIEGNDKYILLHGDWIVKAVHTTVEELGKTSAKLYTSGEIDNITYPKPSQPHLGSQFWAAYNNEVIRLKGTYHLNDSSHKSLN